MGEPTVTLEGVGTRVVVVATTAEFTVTLTVPEVEVESVESPP
jgi:hypothetical protein